MTNHKGRYLEGLSVSLKAVHEQGDDIQSADFARLCDHILEAFDHLGTIMYFAKVEMGGKVESIRKVSAQLKTLREVRLGNPGPSWVRTSAHTWRPAPGTVALRLRLQSARLRRRYSHVCTHTYTYMCTRALVRRWWTRTCAPVAPPQRAAARATCTA